MPLDDIARDAMKQAPISDSEIDGFNPDDVYKLGADADPNKPDPLADPDAPPQDPAPAPADTPKDPDPEPAQTLTKEELADAAKAAADDLKAGDPPKDPEPAKEPATEPPTRRGWVPRSRLNQKNDVISERDEQLAAVNAALAEATKKIDTLEQKMSGGSVDPLDQSRLRVAEIDKQIVDAYKDGEADTAAKLRAEQRKLETDIMRAELAPQAPKADTELDAAALAVEHMELKATVTGFEDEFPILTKSNKEFDADVSEEVMDLFDTFSARHTPVKAMQMAVGYVVESRGIMSKSELSEQAAASKAGDRKTPDVRKNADAASRQPPDITQAGHDADKGGVTRELDVMSMSIEQFEKLNDEQVAAMSK